MQAPTVAHWEALLGMLRYVRGTIKYGIMYGGSAAVLKGYFDANHQGCADTFRSTTGWVYLFGGGAIVWRSKLQSVVSRSTAESEYRAAGDACCEAMHLKYLLPVFGLEDGPVSLLGDNEACLAIMNNHMVTDRTKHIAKEHRFATEAVDNKLVSVSYIRSQLNLADFLTKVLPRPQFESCLTGIGVGPVP
jgi:hypothetical protein